MWRGDSPQHTTPTSHSHSSPPETRSCTAVGHSSFFTRRKNNNNRLRSETGREQTLPTVGQEVLELVCLITLPPRISKTLENPSGNRWYVEVAVSGVVGGPFWLNTARFRAKTGRFRPRQRPESASRGPNCGEMAVLGSLTTSGAGRGEGGLRS